MIECKHLKETGMTYFAHCKRSLKFTLWNIKMSYISFVHAIIPCAFTDTFSENVLRLAQQLKEEQDAEY